METYILIGLVGILLGILISIVVIIIIVAAMHKRYNQRIANQQNTAEALNQMKATYEKNT